MKTPFRYFSSSPEVIRLTVTMYIYCPPTLRQVEGLFHERGIDICCETVVPVGTGSVRCPCSPGLATELPVCVLWVALEKKALGKHLRRANQQGDHLRPGDIEDGP